MGVAERERETSSADRGLRAERPGELSRRGWWEVAKRVRRGVKRDNVGLVSAGVAFYAFFSLSPALTAVVTVYGLLADPAQVDARVAAVADILPAAVVDIVRSQLQRVAAGSTTALGWGFALSLGIAIWSASKGVRNLMKALNIAYGEDERRGVLKKTGVVLILTVGGLVTAIVALFLVAAVPPLIGALSLGTAGRVLAEVARWLVLAALIVGGLAVIYRYGPSRDEPKWRWVSVGSGLAAVLWLSASVGFSLFVQFFDTYHATFGALGAVAVLLMWFFLSALAVMLGAEVNAEAERQARRAPSVGHPAPPGQRALPWSPSC